MQSTELFKLCFIDLNQKTKTLNFFINSDFFKFLSFLLSSPSPSKNVEFITYPNIPHLANEHFEQLRERCWRYYCSLQSSQELHTVTP